MNQRLFGCAYCCNLMKISAGYLYGFILLGDFFLLVLNLTGFEMPNQTPIQPICKDVSVAEAAACRLLYFKCSERRGCPMGKQATD